MCLVCLKVHEYNGWSFSCYLWLYLLSILSPSTYPFLSLSLPRTMTGVTVIFPFSRRHHPLLFSESTTAFVVFGFDSQTNVVSCFSGTRSTKSCCFHPVWSICRQPTIRMIQVGETCMRVRFHRFFSEESRIPWSLDLIL